MARITIILRLGKTCRSPSFASARVYLSVCACAFAGKGNARAHTRDRLGERKRVGARKYGGESAQERKKERKKDGERERERESAREEKGEGAKEGGRKKEREEGREGGRKRERERERECVCVCERESVFVFE